MLYFLRVLDKIGEGLKGIGDRAVKHKSGEKERRR
jgi:hypothetical protein